MDVSVMEIYSLAATVHVSENAGNVLQAGKSTL